MSRLSQIVKTHPEANSVGPFRNRPVIPPLKHKRYRGAMTICIAAICQDQEKPFIVLCSDTKMSQGEFGSTDTTIKLDMIGKGWMAQMSNRLDSARELASHIRENFESSGLATRRAVLDALQRASDDFKSSPLCVPHCCEMLVTGFVKNEPVIAVFRDDSEGDLQMNLEESFAAIGSGANIATVFMNSRDYAPSMRIEDAAYYVYEAKRFSEKAEGVGKKTLLLWQSPQEPAVSNSARLSIVSPMGLGVLETIHQVNRGPVQINIAVPGFTLSPEEIQALQSPKADPSPQQPSPG